MRGEGQVPEAMEAWTRGVRTDGDGGASAVLVVGGWAAVGAGVAGLLGLLSVIPWPELFSLDANPGNALVLEPGLKAVLVGHYAILVVGGMLGLVAAILLALSLRHLAAALAGASMLAGACLALGYVSTVRAVDVAVNDGRAANDVATVVWAAGTLLLVAVAVLTLALREHAGRIFLALGLGSPALVAGGIAAFATLGPDVYPEIWGLTFPPPTDYLLAAWFIGLGRVMRRGLGGAEALAPPQVGGDERPLHSGAPPS